MKSFRASTDAATKPSNVTSASLSHQIRQNVRFASESMCGSVCMNSHPMIWRYDVVRNFTVAVGFRFSKLANSCFKVKSALITH